MKKVASLAGNLNNHMNTYFSTRWSLYFNMEQVFYVNFSFHHSKYFKDMYSRIKI